MHHYFHVLPTDYNPYSANLAGVHDRSHVPSQSFSKAAVLTIAVKVLGMLQHTKSPLIELEVDIKRLLFSLAVKMLNV